MINTGSELISEIVGPAGSISDGAFSWAYTPEEDELWLLELPFEDWAQDGAAAIPASRQKKAAKEHAIERSG
jgi:hypothetical protein